MKLKLNDFVKFLQQWVVIIEADVGEMRRHLANLERQNRGVAEVVMESKEDKKRIDFLEDRVGYLEDRLEQLLNERENM